jgi:CRP-like cAMP-binding protein
LINFPTQKKKHLLKELEFSKNTKKEGQLFFQRGDKCKSLFVILEGVISIIRSSFKHDREEQVNIVKLKKGFIFGEISMISNYKRTTGAITESPLVILMEIDKKTLESFDLSIQKLFHKEMISVLIRRLDDMNRKYMQVIN